jgi:hypothetical protein
MGLDWKDIRYQMTYRTCIRMKPTLSHVAIAVILFSAALVGPTLSEERAYGEVELTGLARNDWELNRPGPWNAMVCDVNGSDGFLTVREKPSSSSGSVRKLERLAVIEVDTRQRQGHWIKVTGAYRNHSKSGQRQAYKALPLRGWAHDDYLCSFLD